MGILLCVICCVSLAAFNICSLCLIFVNLINVSWGVSPWVYPVWDSLGFLDLGDYFLPHFREVFNYCLLKYFLMVFLSSSGTPMIRMFGHLKLSQRSLRLSSFLLIPFSFFLSVSFISTILSSTSLILSSTSVILLFVPSGVFFYLIFCILHYILTLLFLLGLC